MAPPHHEAMLATRWAAPFDDPDWWFEVKWDGVRTLVEADADETVLRSRRSRRVDSSYPEFTGFRFDRPTVIDGEIVALDDRGVPSFSLLQRRMNNAGALALGLVEKVPLTLMVFDLLHHGEALIDRPIEERWDRLNEVVPVGMVVSPPTREHGRAVYDAIVDKGLEGMVAKRSGSIYRPGIRSSDWRKVVHRTSGRFVVGGYLPGDGNRTTSFASLLLGLWQGDDLRFVGAVGSGFDSRSLRHIRDALDQMERTTSPFVDDRAIPQEAKWVHPALVAIVEYREWTHDDHLRAPTFKGFGNDPVESVTWEAERA
jgi:bifunctional non-homologous end joining protein LigD